MIGTQDRSSHVYGLSIGLDYQATDTAKLGFALSGGTTSFGLAGNMGNGSSAMIQAALYGRETFDDAYVSGVLGYAFHDVSTDRYVDIAGLDHFSANFSAQDLAAQLEAGYHLGWFTPYAAVKGQAFFTPAYSETTVSGNSTFALDYGPNTSLTGRTEIGAKLDWNTDFEQGMLALHASAAWAHDYGSASTVQASFQALPGSSFTVEGATADADSLLLSAAANMALGNGFGLGASVNGDFARNARSYGGTVEVSRSW